jgi:hypothetical protein
MSGKSERLANNVVASILERKGACLEAWYHATKQWAANDKRTPPSDPFWIDAFPKFAA